LKRIFLTDIYATKRNLRIWYLDEYERPGYIDKNIRPEFFIKNNSKIARSTAFKIKDNFDGVGVSVCDVKSFAPERFKAFSLMCDDLEVYRIVKKYIFDLEHFDLIDIYDLDIDPAESFCFKHNISMFSWCRLEDDGKIHPDEDIDKVDYTIPFLKKMYIGFENDSKEPSHMKGLPPIYFKFEGDIRRVVQDDEFEYLEEMIKSEDPDIIIASYGDAHIIPILLSRGMNCLSRDKDFKYSKTGEKSFFSYGRTIYKSRSSYLKGRIHIDPENSFYYKEVGLEGLIDLARISSMSIQKIARTSPGTVISSMETGYVLSAGNVVPVKKNLSERSRTVRSLVESDKGGLSFRPDKGLFFNVAELDFFSMYPSIMVKYNLSGETIDCSHDECNKKVPGTDYTYCGRKKGVVACAVNKVLVRRARIKSLMKKCKSKDEFSELNNRQKALKWLLVVSFGYLGYKNARFGRIESHEATTSVGREMLLMSKECAEDKGFKILHGLTDAIWVYKKGANKDDFLKLTQYINQKINSVLKGTRLFDINLKIALKGIYKWIYFPVGVKAENTLPNKYYGVFENGKVKTRGIALRRHDTPKVICNFQKQSILILSEASTKEEFRQKTKLVRKIYEDIIKGIKSSFIDIEDLYIEKRVSKEYRDYKVSSYISNVMATYAHNNIEVRPGEKIRYVLVQDPEVKALPLEFYDDSNHNNVNIEEYCKLLHRAYEELK